MESKWLYRLESMDEDMGLWYNSRGEFVLTIAEIANCETKNMQMDYDERYKRNGMDWYSSCSNIEDLLHWYSFENARDLIKKGFRLSKYLAVDYVEYNKETVFLKETCLDRVTLDINEVFLDKGGCGMSDKNKNVK